MVNEKEPEPLHVSQLNSQQLLRLSRWFQARGEDLVDELSKTAGSLTPEQEAVALDSDLPLPRSEHQGGII